MREAENLKYPHDVSHKGVAANNKKRRISMKKLLLLISILCLSSSAFNQQPQRRANYYHYEMDAVPLSVIQVNLNAKVNVFLLDDDNFQKYRDGKGFAYSAGGLLPYTPFYIVPPKQQHWYLVMDAGGRPFTANVPVRLFSEPKELEPEKQ